MGDTLVMSGRSALNAISAPSSAESRGYRAYSSLTMMRRLPQSQDLMAANPFSPKPSVSGRELTPSTPLGAE